MKNYIIEEPFTERYIEILRDLVCMGKEVSPRGKKTIELRPVVFNFKQSRNRLITISKRNINPFFLVAETLWILNGENKVFPLSVFNDGISKFSDDSEIFHGAYGKRIFEYPYGIKNSIDQIKEVINIFNNNKDSRQAVVSIWNTIDDLNVITKDMPCNNMIYFKVREDKLNMTVVNRSNDVHLGLTTNHFQFSSIFDFVAKILNFEVGEYTHFTDSLHYYVDSPITNRLLGEFLVVESIYENEPLLEHPKIWFNDEVLFMSNIELYELVKIKIKELWEEINSIALCLKIFSEEIFYKPDIKALNTLKNLLCVKNKANNYYEEWFFLCKIYMIYKFLFKYLKDFHRRNFSSNLESEEGLKATSVKFLLNLMLDILFMEYTQRDLQILCMNYLYTRVIKLLEKDFINNEMKNLILDMLLEFENRLEYFLKRFNDEEKLFNFICESKN